MSPDRDRPAHLAHPVGPGVYDDEAEEEPGLAEEAAAVLAQLDGLAHLWGDEAVFRRCRDRLRSALARHRTA